METVSRQRRRAAKREEAKGVLKIGNGPGRRMKWLMRHPKLVPFYTLAHGVLQNGDRAQKPSWRAVRKMMVLLATAPRITLPGVGRVPYIIAKYRHERPSWRSFPHQVINANLQVEQ